MLETTPSSQNTRIQEYLMMTHRPRDDEVVGGVAAAHHVVWVLEGHILGGEAHLGVARGQTVANLP